MQSRTFVGRRKFRARLRRSCNCNRDSRLRNEPKFLLVLNDSFPSYFPRNLQGTLRCLVDWRRKTEGRRPKLVLGLRSRELSKIPTTVDLLSCHRFFRDHYRCLEGRGTRESCSRILKELAHAAILTFEGSSVARCCYMYLESTLASCWVSQAQTFSFVSGTSLVMLSFHFLPSPPRSQPLLQPHIQFAKLLPGQRTARRRKKKSVDMKPDSLGGWFRGLIRYRINHTYYTYIYSLSSTRFVRDLFSEHKSFRDKYNDIV